ncbi:DUF998 domain-containing protein [Halobacterium yunchengense]|uniref:DUF998 domain-containing protein n=1 Tax=Halobacterium yunchengense TaxID=3108497 RepID=UPI003009450D
MRTTTADADSPRAARLSGAAAVVVSVGSILLATALSSTFTWPGSALSDLGVETGVAWLFNGGLLSGALLAAPYAWALYRVDTALAARVRAAAFAAAAVGMAGVGLFPLGHALHVPAAVAFFASATATLLADGAARRRTRRGRVALASGVLTPLAWPAWAAAGPGDGIAVPEFVGVVLFGAWVLALSPVRPLDAGP